MAKLILLLDPDDPMGVMLCVDYFALRAHKYSWLQVNPSVYPRLLVAHQHEFVSSSVSKLPHNVKLLRME